MSIKFNVGRIEHDQFGIVKELDVEFNLLVMKEKNQWTTTTTEHAENPEGGTPNSSNDDANNFQPDSAYLKELHTKLFIKLREFLPNSLDDEISIKIQYGIDLTLLTYAPELNDSRVFEFMAVNNISKIASSDNLELIMEKVEEHIDEEEDGPVIPEYSMFVKYRPELRKLMTGETPLETAIQKIPLISTEEALKVENLITLARELNSNPDWLKTTQEQKRWVIKEFMNNMTASFFTRHDQISNGTFSNDTYESLLQYDNNGALYVIEICALFAKIELHSEIRSDLLFQRLKHLYGLITFLFHSLVMLPEHVANVTPDCQEQILQNILLVQFIALKKKRESAAARDGEAGECQISLEKLVNSIKAKIHVGISDLQILCDKLPKCFPENEDLKKYILLIIRSFNGQLRFYSTSHS